MAVAALELSLKLGSGENISASGELFDLVLGEERKAFQREGRYEKWSYEEAVFMVLTVVGVA